MAEAGGAQLTGTVVRVMDGSNADLSDPEKLRVSQETINVEMKEDSVLVKVDAFALNPIDYKMNDIIPDHPTEYILAIDFAGTIVKMGDGLQDSDLNAGDKVLGNSNLQFGTAAQYITCPVNMLAKYEEMKLADAAGVPLAAVTAYDCVEKLGELEKGSTVMINGASGGVGTYLLQICAKVKDYNPIAICSGKNASFCKDLGAADVINYKEEDFASYGEKIHGFVDCVGGLEVWEKAQNILEEKAAFVTICGDDPQFDGGEGGLKASLDRSQDESNTYSFVFMASNSEKLQTIASWISDGLVQPQTHNVYEVENVHNAIKDLKTKRATGKIVVTFDNQEEG